MAVFARKSSAENSGGGNFRCLPVNLEIYLPEKLLPQRRSHTKTINEYHLSLRFAR